MYIETGGKIGIHSLRPKNCLAYIQALKARGARFPVVKAVDDLDWLVQVKEVDAAILTIGRIKSADESLGGIESEPDLVRRAQGLMAPVLAKLAANPALRTAVDYWEVCNEPDPPGAQGYARLAECMKACMTLAEANGLKLALFALNAGTPEWDEMKAMVATGVFGRMRAGSHILTLHEGQFWSVERAWTDPINYGMGWRLPGVSDAEWEGLSAENVGGLVFRYRYLYHLLKERGEVVPLVVSEVVYGGGYAQDGGTVADTRDRAAWYDGEAAKDYYVLAHLPFTLGANAGEEWARRDYEFAYPTLVDYMASVADRPNAVETGGPGAPPPVWRELFAGAWSDAANKQIPAGWAYAVREGDNPYGDGAEWNRFADPEWVHLFFSSDPQGWTDRGEAGFFNEAGITYKMFTGRAWMGDLWRPTSLNAGRYRVTVDFVGDWYYWEDNAKQRVPDPQHARGWLFLSDKRQEIEFDSLGPNVVSAEFTVSSAGIYRVGMTWLSAYAATNNGLFVRSVTLEAIEEPAPPPEPGQYRVVVNVLPQDVSLDELGAITTLIAPERGTFTHSADDAHLLLAQPRARADSEARLWLGYGRYSSADVALIRSAGKGVVERFLPVAPPPTPPPLPGAFAVTHWPTEVTEVTQPFGVRPEVYSQYGLPGHEGVDLRAATNTPIVAIADGDVIAVGDDRLPKSKGGHNYGVRVYLAHADGYTSIYAHLNSRQVNVGDRVQAGSVLGMADTTGNATGPHLHLTLKKAGATVRGETDYPNDIIDPTPWLAALPGAPFLDMARYLNGGQTVARFRNTGGSEEVFWYRSNGSAAFDIVKNRQFEEIRVTRTAIQRRMDTSPGNDLVYAQFSQPGRPWADWCPRYAVLGWRYPRRPWVEFKRKDNCQTTAAYSDPSDLLIADRWETWADPTTGRAWRDVILLKWYKGSDWIENYYLAAGIGYIRFEAAGFQSWLTEILTQPTGDSPEDCHCWGWR